MLALATTTALAFSGPIRAPAARSAVRMAGLADMPGASIEVPFNGGKPWDPLGFSKLNALPVQTSRPSANPSLKWLREAELKHGRICMLAFLGTLIQTFTPHLPGPAFAEMDWFKASSTFAAQNPGGAFQIFFGIALVEGQTFPEEFYEAGGGSREAGNLGFDPLGLSKGLSAPQKAEMQLKELKNGRLAMIAWAALVSSKLVPGSVPGLP